MRLEEEVLKPLRSWLQAYRTVCERMENLERLRLELDSRRRTVDGLRDKLDRLKDTQPPAKEKEKHDQELEKTTQMLQHKREKQDRTASAFQELEQTVFNSLNTLIKDTGVLRDYTGLSLSILQDCFQKSHAAFSTATPLLDYNSTSDNMFNHQQSAYQHQHLPVIEKAQSERALMVRQLADRPAAAPGTAKGGGMPMYGADDLGGDANMPYGIDQQVHAAPVAPMGAYPDVPQPVGPSGANGNPYAGAYQSPNATRYFQPMQY
ncbi:hypothetical protein HYH03_015941 [Edaphochlamys debaryana]|uniref:Uncharacterized protein n=1 Tax=Edaphochlamys debaryana TaxID=47281 RepID=A0A835XK12_9CHLO|nr:hypothetical protein HYH03_015941 [Edaphochlamys debaryana]|eukprot:KAG2485266.1 hypothetical protein HYH03_015941 [Edaphochlamys debaryana]